MGFSIVAKVSFLPSFVILPWHLFFFGQLLPFLFGLSCSQIMSKKGGKSVDWNEFKSIAISWGLSPILSGFVSLSIFLLVKYTILVKVSFSPSSKLVLSCKSFVVLKFIQENSYELGLRIVPFIYGCTFFVNITLVVSQIFTGLILSFKSVLSRMERISQKHSGGSKPKRK